MSEDDRIIKETGLDARVAALAFPVAQDLGLQLVRVRISGQNGMTVQVMAERPDGTMTITDCEKYSRALSPVLDVEDVIDRAFHLEVSSPGIDRPMVRAADFETWNGHVVKLQTEQMIAGRRKFVGTIVALQGNTLRLNAAKNEGAQPEPVEIPLSAISDARLMMTDDLIAESLKRDKAARKASGLPETDELGDDVDLEVQDDEEFDDDIADNDNVKD